MNDSQGQHQDDFPTGFPVTRPLDFIPAVTKDGKNHLSLLDVRKSRPFFCHYKLL